jgi:hypothetical protein
MKYIEILGDMFDPFVRVTDLDRIAATIGKQTRLINDKLQAVKQGLESRLLNEELRELVGGTLKCSPKSAASRAFPESRLSLKRFHGKAYATGEIIATPKTTNGLRRKGWIIAMMTCRMSRR